MAYTVPTTRATGFKVDASTWNTDIVENLKYFKDAPVFGGDVSVSATKKLYLDGGSNTYLQEVSADTVIAVTNGSERLRVTSGGVVQIGSATSRTLTSLTSLVQVETAGSTNQQLSLIANRNDTGGASIILGKSRGTTVGSNTVVADGDNLGFIRWNAADGVDMDSIAAQILAQVDGAPGSNDTPGRLIFSTAQDGAATVTEAMRITSTQRVQCAGTLSIGGATPATTGAGITFPAAQSASSDANTLDDYEEATYTATLTPQTSGSVTLNASFNEMQYTKVGRTVHVSGRLKVTSVSSPLGNIALNLPFTGATLTDEAGGFGGGITLYDGANYSVIPFGAGNAATSILIVNWTPAANHEIYLSFNYVV